MTATQIAIGTSTPWIEIFRAGDYRSKGKGLITRADLDRVVRNYDPSYHEAPITIGHPQDNKPAYGWVEQLAVEGDMLLAREKQVDPQFDEARKKGYYKKRSAAFYQDAEGQLTGLRHVAYLGAQPPEVKGLKDVEFDDHGLKFIEVDFNEEEVVDDKKSITEQIKATIAEIFGAPTQPKTFSEDDAKRIATEAATAAAAPLQAKVTELETQLNTQKAQFAERENALAQGDVKQRAAAAVLRLKSASAWIPAFEKMGLGPVFEELAKSTTTIEFGEGDAKKTITPLETLVVFLEGLPKIVPGGRLIEASAQPHGGKTSGDPLTDAAKARQKEKNITFSEALDEIVAEKPELAAPGRTTAGVV